MRSLLRSIDRLCALGSAAAAACIAVVVVLVLTEVVCRKFFSLSLDFAWEWATYLTAGAFLLASGQALRVGQHVRVRLILDWLPPALSRIVDMAAVAVSLALALYLAWAIGHLTWASQADGTRSFLPSNSLLWPFQAVVTAGSLLFSAQLFAFLVRQIRGEPPEQAPGSEPLERID